MKLKKWIKPLLLSLVALSTTAIVAPIVVSCGDNSSNGDLNPPPSLETSYNISFKKWNASYPIGNNEVLVNTVDESIVKNLIIKHHKEIFDIKEGISGFDWTNRMKITIVNINENNGSVKFLCELDRSRSNDNPDIISNELTITGFKYYGNTPTIKSNYNPSEAIKNAGFTQEAFNKIVNNFKNCKHIYKNGKLEVNEFKILLEGDQFTFLYFQVGKWKWEGYRYTLTKNSEGKYKFEVYLLTDWNPNFDKFYSKDELKKQIEDWYYNHKG